MGDEHFAAVIKATNRMKLSIGGVTNDICTINPALSLVRNGFELQVVADAGASLTAMIDDNALRRRDKTWGSLTTINQLIAKLTGSWTTPEGGEL